MFDESISCLLPMSVLRLRRKRAHWRSMHVPVNISVYAILVFEPSNTMSLRLLTGRKLCYSPLRAGRMPFLIFRLALFCSSLLIYWFNNNYESYRFHKLWHQLNQQISLGFHLSGYQNRTAYIF